MGEAVSNSLPLNIVSLFIPVLFYFLGLNSNLEEFKILFGEKKSLLYGIGIQLILLPAVGLLVAEIFRDYLFAVSAVIVTIPLSLCVPEIPAILSTNTSTASATWSDI